MADTVTLRFTDEEQKIFKESAKLYGCSMSSMIKRLAIEKLEDDMDINSIYEYENKKRKKSLSVRPIDKLWSELKLDD